MSSVVSRRQKSSPNWHLLAHHWRTSGARDGPRLARRVARSWRTTDRECELLVFCPECAKREFADGK
jgi:hypothetical protein